MAGNPALIVRVASTIEELKKNLAEGVSQIETTTAAMGKLSASFSGDKLIQAAMNVTAAVNQIGGASKLTEAEQARVNATLEKALEKYRVLGREAPAGMQQLANDTKQADVASGGLMDTVKSLALGFAAMFTARAAFNFIKDTLNEASALKDLSQQTHINVEDLQRLAGAMSEFGVDADTLGKGLYKLSRGIAGGDESVASGLHLMGMSLKDVEGLNGKELFLKIEGGLATLQGGLRDTAAADLFGGKLGSAMAGASEGIEGALETWQRLNEVASTESVDAMDQFGESITRAQKNLSSIAANMMGPVAQGFNVLSDAAAKGAGWWAVVSASLKDLDDKVWRNGTGTANLTKLLDEQNKTTDANAAATKKAAGAHDEATVALTAQGAAQKFMAALELDAAKPLLAWQEQYLGHLKDIGALNAKNAAGIGVSVDQFKAYEAATKSAADAEKEAAKIEEAAILGVSKLREEYYQLIVQHGGTANAIAIAGINKWAADTTAAAVKAKTDTADFYNWLAVNSKEKLGAVGINWDLWKTSSIAAQNEIADNERRTLNEMIASGGFHRDEIEKQRLKYEEARDAARGYGHDAIAAQDAAAAAAKRHNDELLKQQEIVAALAAANRAMGNSTKIDTTTQAGRDKIDPAIATWLQAGYSLAQASAIAFDLAWKIPINANDPLFAHKGPREPGYAGGVENAPGGWAMVGERGPEAMYVPPGSTIRPNGSPMNGGETHLHVYVTQPLATPTAIAAAVDAAVMKRMRDTGVRF